MEEEKLAHALPQGAGLDDEEMASEEEREPVSMERELVSAPEGAKCVRSEEDGGIDAESEMAVMAAPQKKKCKCTKKIVTEVTDEAVLKQKTTAKWGAKENGLGDGRVEAIEQPHMTGENGKGNQNVEPRETTRTSVFGSIVNNGNSPSRPLVLSHAIVAPPVVNLLSSQSMVVPAVIDPLLLQESASAAARMRGLYGGVPITGPNDNPNPFSVQEDHLDAGLFLPDHALGGPAASTGSPSRQDETFNDSVFLDPSIWSDWFMPLHEMLEGLELPGQWNMVLMYFTILEGHNAFQQGTEPLPPASRLPAVQAWIRGG